MIPTSIYQTKGTVKTQRLQPKIRRINAKYKGDQKRYRRRHRLSISARDITP